MKIIISGGGTGGHIYPAIAVAQELKKKLPDIEILFVGAKGKMEMEKVPKAGFEIKGLWISGLQRKFTTKNLLFPLKLISSLWTANKIVTGFNPDAIIGFGGFASGPVGQIAAWKKIPLFLQEQNSYPGITNKLLARKAKKICVAYNGLEKYFPKEKIVITGNPVRMDIVISTGTKTDKDINSSLRYFDLVQNKKTVLVFGGSLGAGSLNEAVKLNLKNILSSRQVNLIWQVGKYYFEEYKNLQNEYKNNLKILPFIDRMDLAYKISDLVVCRAGALTISELSLAGKAAILVPSPNVAEDHQTKNALNLVNKSAAVMIKDQNVKIELGDKINELLNNDILINELEKNIKKLSKPNASSKIAEVVLNNL